MTLRSVVPSDLTPTERMDAASNAAHSLLLLLDEIERGNLKATTVEIVRLRAAAEALQAILGDRAREGG